MSEPFYREELCVLRDLVVLEIGRQDPGNMLVMAALGSLHIKIVDQLKTAVSYPVPDHSQAAS